jgi:hypothetical protein
VTGQCEEHVIKRRPAHVQVVHAHVRFAQPPHRFDERALALTHAEAHEPVLDHRLVRRHRRERSDGLVRVGVLVEPNVESLTADAVLELVGDACQGLDVAISLEQTVSCDGEIVHAPTVRDARAGTSERLPVR